jgi:hypothetical protein
VKSHGPDENEHGDKDTADWICDHPAILVDQDGGNNDPDASKCVCNDVQQDT